MNKAVTDSHIVKWLSFFGKPALIAEPGGTPLAMRYRKSLALLAFISSQPNRPVRRDALAELFWPQKTHSEGMRNLRVILNDLSSNLNRMGLGAALETNRQWLTFHTGSTLYTDEILLKATGSCLAQQQHLAQHLSRISTDLWGESFEADESSTDWSDWLTSRRAYLERLRDEYQSNRPTSDTCPPTSLPQPRSAPELAHIALLRVETSCTPTDLIDERAALLNWRQTMDDMVAECTFLGGNKVSADATGITFAFGLNSLNSSFRWQALRAAAAIELRFGRQPGLRISLSAGHCIVERYPDGSVDITGWRTKWIERLAYLVPPGRLIADEGFADLAPLFGLEPQDIPLTQSGQTHTFFVQSFDRYHLPDLPPLNNQTALFGRDNELIRLEQLWQESQRGTPRRIVLSAPPGMGKTRLVWEFARKHLAEGARLTWLGARSETASQPWSLIYDWLFRAQHSTPLHQILDRHQEQLLRQFLAQRSVPLMEKGEFERLLTQLLKYSTLIVVDDAHWIDQASAQMLCRILTQLSHGLILITQRKTGNQHFSLPDCYTLPLSPLSDAAAAEMLDTLGHIDSSSRNRRSALHQARGIPIYLLSAAQEAQSNKPTTEFLAATINAIRPALPALGGAALMGLHWQLSDLTVLVGEAQAQQAVSKGREGHILVNYDADHWAFFHPLIHETILAALPLTERSRLATEAARLFASRHEHGRAAPLWEVAGHIDAARTNWRAAAQHAEREQDAVAACSHYGQLERLGYGHSTADLWDRIRHTRARVIHDGYGTELTCRHSYNILELLPTEKNEEQREIEFSALALIYLWSGGQDKTTGLKHAGQLALHADTPIRKFAADWAFGNTHFWLGQFSQARPYLEAVLHTSGKLGVNERTRYFPSDPASFAAPTHAWLLWFVGDPNWEKELHDLQVQLRSGHTKQDLCIGLTLSATTYFSSGNHEAFIRDAREAYNIASADGFAFWEVISGLLLCIASALNGEPIPIERIHAYEQAVSHVYPAGSNSARWLGAEALVAAGKWESAAAMIDLALAEADSCEHAFCLPSLWRLRSEVHTTQGQFSLAQSALQQALAIARKMGAHGWIHRWKDSLSIVQEACHP